MAIDLDLDFCSRSAKAKAVTKTTPRKVVGAKASRSHGRTKSASPESKTTSPRLKPAAKSPAKRPANCTTAGSDQPKPAPRPRGRPKKVAAPSQEEEDPMQPVAAAGRARKSKSAVNKKPALEHQKAASPQKGEASFQNICRLVLCHYIYHTICCCLCTACLPIIFSTSQNDGQSGQVPKLPQD